ncbi:MAG: DUF2809 domain-containing protein [Williamsia sp.]|nr:DUF2809 domain-containing protein [Williamsia sp.]
MNASIKFRKYHFALAILLFVVEVLIALYAHDRFIRPYAGDFLVVIFVYCTVRAFVDMPVLKTAILVLLFSYVVEVLQYFNLVGRLGLQNSALARTVLGSSFEWLDLLAYTLGAISVLYAEKYLAIRASKKPTSVTRQG